MLRQLGWILLTFGMPSICFAQVSGIHWESRLAAQEAEIAALRAELATERGAMPEIDRLPPVTNAALISFADEKKDAEKSADVKKDSDKKDSEKKDGGKKDGEKKEGDKKDGDKKKTSDERLKELEKEWKEFKEKQKKEKADAALKPTVQLNGQVNTDTVFFSQDNNSRATLGDLQDGADFRRARLVARGKAFETMEYIAGFDFALNGRPGFLDVAAEFHELPVVQNWRTGRFFEPFTMERYEINRNNTFMERSLVDAFAPARTIGTMILGQSDDKNSTYALGVFRTNTNDFGDSAWDGGYAVTGRLTRLLYYDEISEGRHYFHIGGAYSYRDAINNQVTFQTTPEMRLRQPSSSTLTAPIFLTTTVNANSYQLLGSELSWTEGPLSMRSEYVYVPVDQRGGPNSFFQGAYAEISYFLTGEHRPYDKIRGVHDRVQPFTNFFRVLTEDRGVQMGPGAWELAARYSWIDLNDNNIRGGQLQDATAGVNWYLNPYTRVRFNYVHAFLDNPIRGLSGTDIFGFRFDFDF